MADINVIYFAKLAMYTAVLISLPIMGVSFLAGLLVGIFQALTQIQDQTFSFVVKLIAIFLVTLVSMAWIVNKLLNFISIIYNLH